MSIDKAAVTEDLLCATGLAHLDNAGAALMPRCVVLDTFPDGVAGELANWRKVTSAKTVLVARGRKGVDEVETVMGETACQFAENGQWFSSEHWCAWWRTLDQKRWLGHGFVPHVLLCRETRSSL